MVRPGKSSAASVEEGRAAAGLDPADVELIVSGGHGDPHRILGRHEGVVRAFRPDAAAMRLVAAARSGTAVPATTMERVHPAGLFEGSIERDATGYHLEADYATGMIEPPTTGSAGAGSSGAGSPGGATSTTFRFDDPYRSWPTLGDLDLHLFGEGRHRRLWEVLGAHTRSHDGMVGTSFAVWAPNARAVRVVGEWNFWDGRVHPMRSLGSSGVWELFVPGVAPGSRYKYELVAADGEVILKADPMANATEVPPATASVVAAPSAHRWGDQDWMKARATGDPLAQPMSVYEVHLGSWLHTSDGHGGGRPLTYRELAEKLPAYVAELGFTHVELMPVAEHPFAGSWGYQISAYYAPSSRGGSPDDFRALVDAFHSQGVGVIVDWVPAHFPRDAFALARFDGTALYEHEDPRKGTQPDWGTLVFNFGRAEVRNFMVANALYWIDQFHIDALRVDAVASMLYLDYSRKEGEWVPNEFGGRENLEAVAFLREVNEAVFSLHPGATTIAEESTAWPGVSRPTYLGGLGFGWKWNMGWMHDTLEYFTTDALFRRYHQNELTFGLVYSWSENFVLPISHDEVVHGKGSLLTKMPGDRWQQLANLRAFLAWMWAHPGKQLLFMGSELGQEREWNHDRDLDWWLLGHDGHRGIQGLVAALNRLYRSRPALWTQDVKAEGFAWIDASDTERSVVSFLRIAAPPSGSAGAPTWPSAAPEGIDTLACIANLTPVPHLGYRIGLPSAGEWKELLNTDASEWAGSGLGNGGRVSASAESWHGQPASAELVLPPLSVLWLVPA
ncbi:MAG: 1,4-alpha-glucan branching protein GlgB [Actinomycetota bacterium]|nr:1,4-alpha-glucan branching protein GlgB [Actinomycetota bacterium]